MTKLYCFLIASLASISSSWAQNTEWATPHVGYSSTDMLNVDKVEFKKSATVMHVTASGREGATFWIAPTASLKAGNQKYAVKKVPKVGIDKKCTIPKGGKVHFTMHFDPLPQGTEVMHFTESDGDEGWHLCNIRKGKADTSMPEEWKDVKYERESHLPPSVPSDDSTTVRVRILNYVPEAGKTFTVSFHPIDFDQADRWKTFPIQSDGTATFKLHTCFPMTTQARIGGGEYFPLLIVPGKDTDILLDLERGGTCPAVGFKGALATTNYELNVRGAKDLISHPAEDDHFEEIIQSGKDPFSAVLQGRAEDNPKMENLSFCNVTLRWLWMQAELEYAMRQLRLKNFIEAKAHQDLREVGSALMSNPHVSQMIRCVPNYHVSPFIATEEYLTLCPHFEKLLFSNLGHQEGKTAPTRLDDLNTLYWTLIHAAGVSSKEAEISAERRISDPVLKDYYHVAAKRWQQYADSIGRLPHIHFDEHDRHDGAELKSRLLDDYKGRNVVLLFYNHRKTQVIKDLDDLEPLMAAADSRKTVFIHINTDFSVREWLSVAQRYSGEHYGGRRTPYYLMPHDNKASDVGILYELHSPDGTITLSTKDKQEALDAIRKLMKE